MCRGCAVPCVLARKQGSTNVARCSRRGPSSTPGQQHQGSSTSDTRASGPGHQGPERVSLATHARAAECRSCSDFYFATLRRRDALSGFDGVGPQQVACSCCCSSSFCISFRLLAVDRPPAHPPIWSTIRVAGPCRGHRRLLAVTMLSWVDARASCRPRCTTRQVLGNVCPSG
jgi:hypothetical protein